MNQIFISFQIIADPGELDVNDAVLDHLCKLPKCYEECQGEPHVHSTPKSYYDSLYYECLDVSTSAIKSRFHQKDFSNQMYFRAATGENIGKKLFK